MQILLGLCDWYPSTIAAIPHGYANVQLTQRDKLFLLCMVFSNCMDVVFVLNMFVLVRSSWPHSYGYLSAMKLLNVADIHAKWICAKSTIETAAMVHIYNNCRDVFWY